jgi:Flp pilus assembly protein TadG
MRQLNERGAVAAEFALLLPVLLTILFGIIDFGMLMYGREIVTNATREGARAGITQGPPKLTEGAIEAISYSYLATTGISAASVDFEATGAGLANPATLTVSATYTYNFLIPWIPAIVGISNPLLIQTQTVMRHE